MSINATVAKCISPNTIGIWILNDNDSFFKSQAFLPRSDTTLSPSLANYTSYMFPPAEYATNCNGLQQTTMDCNRLQWTAIDCNRLQQSQSYHLYKSHVPLCRVYNGLQQTATDCSSLSITTYTTQIVSPAEHAIHCNQPQPTAHGCNPRQLTATVPYRFRPVENPLFINYKLAAAHSRVAAQQDTDFEAHFHHSIFGYLWVVFHEHFHRRLHRCCFLFCNIYVYINIVYIHINALYTYIFICIYFHTYIYIQINMYR